MATKNDVKVFIRMPRSMRNKLKKLAKSERRSMNAQFLVLLNEGLNKDRAA